MYVCDDGLSIESMTLGVRGQGQRLQLVLIQNGRHPRSAS